jgi:hypothetical protein
MKRLRYSDIRPTLARVMDVCNSSASDATILPILNEAHNRLVNRGKWLGTTQSYRICVGNDSCLVWPRQIETIEAFSVCRDPGTLRNQWYEFSEQGPHGLKESNNWFRTMIDKGTAVAFDEIGGDTDTKKLRVTADVTESGTGRMLLQGWGGPNLTDMNWIRTLDGSTWVDGEYVTISTTPQLTTNFFKRLTGVTKPVTNGPVRVFEWETTTSSQIKQLGYYEADEEVPLYQEELPAGDRQYDRLRRRQCLHEQADHGDCEAAAHRYSGGQRLSVDWQRGSFEARSAGDTQGGAQSVGRICFVLGSGIVGVAV